MLHSEEKERFDRLSHELVSLAIALCQAKDEAENHQPTTGRHLRRQSILILEAISRTLKVLLR